jgi:uncharacterized protein (TIGR03118 family)
MAFSVDRRSDLEGRDIMGLLSWLQLQDTHDRVRGRGRRPAAPRLRPRVQALEDRYLLSGYQQTNLVGYEPGLGHFTDPKLNGWGMVSLPVDVGNIPKGSFCVANAFTTGKATFYDRSGHVLPQTITVPSSSVQTLFGGPGSPGHPTGVVYNPTDGFMITNPQTGTSAPAILIFDTIDGTISGWNPAVDPNQAIVIKDTWADGDPAIYTGLEIAQNSQQQTAIYAADLLNDGVQTFDRGFNPIGAPFTDPSVPNLFSDPNGLNAWSVQAVGNELYVTFANPLSAINGPHGGVVDVFSTDGQLLNHFVANAPGAGPLENPWGITQAPANFGAYSNDLLIGNVAGKGNINVYDPTTGAYLGKMDQPNGAPISIPGLWDLDFGDGTPDSGKTNQLFFDAGPNAPGVSINGLFGVIHAAGDQSGNGNAGPAPQLPPPAQPVQQTLAGLQLQPAVQQPLADQHGAGTTVAPYTQIQPVPISNMALPAANLGAEAGNQIWISPNAADWGWGFGAATSTGAMDLRWVPDGGFGHVLGGKTATTVKM